MILKSSIMSATVAEAETSLVQGPFYICGGRSAVQARDDLLSSPYSSLHRGKPISNLPHQCPLMIAHSLTHIPSALPANQTHTLTGQAYILYHSAKPAISTSQSISLIKPSPSKLICTLHQILKIQTLFFSPHMNQLGLICFLHH